MVALTLACALISAENAHPAEVIVEPSTRYQVIFGYGQGSMDQASVPWSTALSAEAREELLDRLYTLDGDGLGLSICRTYICAGDAPGHAHMGRRPGGSRRPLGYEPEDGVFQWDGHEPSLWHARGAKQRGAFMVAFWSSPPWWMTISGCTSGAAEGSSNLRAGMEDRFAVHICEVLQHYRDAWGIDFDRVSPINEPEAKWWQEAGGQDGCHFDADQAAALLAALNRRLREYGLTARVQAFEAAFASSLGYLDEVLANGEAYDGIAELTCHQYITDFHSLRKWPNRSRLHGKPLWMSEWGDWKNEGLDLAMSYARKLHEAHRLMQAVAWCMWEPSFLFDRSGEGLEPNPAFHAVAQFTRFARPGMVAVEASDCTLKTTGYLDIEGRRLVLVTVNDTEESVELGYDLSAFEGLSDVQAWRTSEADRLLPLEALRANGGFGTTLPARSVTTFRAGYTAIGEPLIVNGGFETGALDGWTGAPDEMTGVQDNYPHGGSFDAFIDLVPGATGALSQEVTRLERGASYALTAACATSGIEATLSVKGAGLSAETTVSGGAYQHGRVEFTAPDDGRVVVAYSAGPTDEERQWATLDSLRLSPLPGEHAH